jgi:hypothetical protein
MAEGDFEVHPLGTTEELRVLREFVKEISREVNAADCGSELKSMIAKINRWYVGHIDRFPL